MQLYRKIKYERDQTYSLSLRSDIFAGMNSACRLQEKYFSFIEIAKMYGLFYFRMCKFLQGNSKPHTLLLLKQISSLKIQHLTISSQHSENCSWAENSPLD